MLFVRASLTIIYVSANNINNTKTVMLYHSHSLFLCTQVFVHVQNITLFLSVAYTALRIFYSQSI